MRQHYAQRRLWIEEALAEQGFVVTLQKGGIQLVIEVEGDDKAQVAKANQAGLAVQALSRWRVVSSGKGAFTVVYQYYFRWHGETGRMAASTGDTVTVSPNGTARACGNDAGPINKVCRHPAAHVVSDAG